MLTTEGLWAGYLCVDCSKSRHRRCDSTRECKCSCNFTGAGLRQIDDNQDYLERCGAKVTWPDGRP